MDPPDLPFPCRDPSSDWSEDEFPACGGRRWASGLLEPWPGQLKARDPGSAPSMGTESGRRTQARTAARIPGGLAGRPGLRYNRRCALAF